MENKKQKIIELKNVAVNYKERKSFFKTEEYQALKDITFDVFKGETLGVIGRNGSGKSTLLRLLAGIIKPDAGEVIHHTRSVSLMALAAGFDQNLSGRQNALISGMLIGHTKKEMKESLDKVKMFSELGGFFEKPVKTYSSGMRARLGFSIAMYTSPDVLLIDEVLAVGDASFREKAENAITQKINSEITVILVSHSEAQMNRLCNRVVWIEEGIVRKEGAAKELFAKYNSMFAFQKLNLKEEEIYESENFFCVIEPIEFDHDNALLKFNCIVIDKLARDIEQVCCNESFILNSGGNTPAFASIYPKNTQAKYARYHGGIQSVGELAITGVIEKKEELIMKFQFGII